MRWVTTLGAVLALVSAAVADEAPIAGRVTAVDPTAQTLTVESAAGGKTRVVVVDVRPGSKIVRFARGADGKFAEQTAALADIKAGWMVSVKTRHEGDREVAEVVRVVHER